MNLTDSQIVDVLYGNIRKVLDVRLATQESEYVVSESELYNGLEYIPHVNLVEIAMNMLKQQYKGSQVVNITVCVCDSPCKRV